MWKRVIIFILCAAILVSGITVGATVLFTNQYETLTNLQSEDSDSTAEVETTATPNVILKTSSDDDPFTETTTPESDYEFGTFGDVALEDAVDTEDTLQEEEYESRAKRILADMTLEEKICQMLFITPEALTGYSTVYQTGAATEAAYDKYPVGGIIYFSQNLRSVSQTTEMISTLQDYVTESTGIGLFIGVDEEGGSVARVADNLGTTSFDDMRVYGEAGDTGVVYDLGYTQASELSALGFNVNFSPCADVLTNENNTVVADRSFGSDPELVSSMVSSVVAGLTDGGILCSPKHFPGHGSTGSDTHNGYASSERTLTELQECDLLPFQAAIDAGAPMIMVGHMTMTEIDPDNPASMSSEVITGILRNRMGYDGIVITDALNMSAITNYYTTSEFAVKCVSAGCDMLLCVSNVSTAIKALTAAVEDGTLTEKRIDESVTRILLAKLRYGIIE